MQRWPKTIAALGTVFLLFACGPDGNYYAQTSGTMAASQWAGQAHPQLGQVKPVAPSPTANAHFESVTPSTWERAAETPVSTFAASVDTSSYALARRLIRDGHLPPRDAVRVEDTVNYFPYPSYPTPSQRDEPFRITPTVLPSPWKPGAKLLHIAVKGWEQPQQTRPRVNLTFLIDVSGSMAPEDRLPLIRKSLHLLTESLRADDTVSIVAYAGAAGVRLPPTPGDHRGEIDDAIDSLQAGGGTAGFDGIRTAYTQAERHFDKKAINRVILATDGDFNIGVTDPRALEELIANKRQTGIYLSIVGVGLDNLNDALMQRLAHIGNGQTAYLDSLLEARKLWQTEMNSSLIPIADDVKIQVEFNPATVAEYRLIGYETRALRRADFNDDRIPAGDINAGHTVTAIYEYLPVGHTKPTLDALRYGAPAAATNHSGARDEIAFVKLRWKAPRAKDSQLISRAVPVAEGQPLERAKDDLRFSVAMAGFAQILRGQVDSSFWPATIALAEGARGADPQGWRAEAVQIMRLAQSLKR